jgi:hypothetical protein
MTAALTILIYIVCIALVGYGVAWLLALAVAAWIIWRDRK